MSTFKFKQFSVQQDQCAMKIGTDGVLLGAWASLNSNPYSILDIGAGTGVIALMMAQRSQAQLIDALEIDHQAYEQCVDNFEQSPWNDRLFCYHADLNEFASEIEDTYDLIISNPPFFPEKSNQEQPEPRALARFQDALPFDHLLSCTAKLLSIDGTMAVVIPYLEQDRFLHIAKQQQLFPNSICYVKGQPQSAIKRSLIQLSFKETRIKEEFLTIETTRHNYTPEYIKLTQPFYLNM